MFLRYTNAAGRSLRYHTEIEAWLKSPIIPAIDTLQATVTVSLYARWTFSTNDSTGTLSFAEFVDSSHVDLPQLRALNPGSVPHGDELRGMRAITRMDTRGRNVTSRVIDAPNLVGDLSQISRGAEGLAIISLRMAVLALPAAPVRPGESWTDSLRYDEAGAVDIQSSLATVGGRGLATFRLERIETRGSSQVAVISTVATINAGASQPGAAAALTISANGRMDFDINQGTLLRSQMDMTGPMMTRGGMIPVHVHLLLTAL